MKYDILHEMPGRIRIHCRNLRLAPDCRIELERWVSEHPMLISAKLSAKTGNLLVTYAKDAGRESILLILDELRIFGVASIGDAAAPSAMTLTDATASAALKKCGEAALKSLIPRPALKIVTGWTIGCGVYAMMDRLLHGHFPAFFFAAGKFILFGLLPSSLLLKIMATAGTLLLENAFPALNPPRVTQRRAFDAVPIQYTMAPIAG